MSVIYCKVDLFAYDQMVYVKDGDSGLRTVAKIPMENLARFLARYSNENNIDEIHLVGYPEFSVDIKNQIIDINKTKFNNRALNVYMDKKGPNNE